MAIPWRTIPFKSILDNGIVMVSVGNMVNVQKVLFITHYVSIWKTWYQWLSSKKIEFLFNMIPSKGFPVVVAHRSFHIITYPFNIIKWSCRAISVLPHSRCQPTQLVREKKTWHFAKPPLKTWKFPRIGCIHRTRSSRFPVDYTDGGRQGLHKQIHLI